ncbi:hypothetical protein [Nonomuraea sp. NPDC050202]|uniref:hypothetical protein n=1 Tax=Nonomuraea sp. NPDC050202 TaxID=3155035 RepID=UPI0033CA2717
MANPDGVLAAIDACLHDALSEDAMRWAPDEPDPTPPFRGVTASHTFIDEAGTALSAARAGWPIIRDDAADVLEWSSVITPVREALVAARELADWASSPGDGLLRISMPDSSESFHRVVGVTPGEALGEYVLTLEPAVTAFSEFATGMRRAAETALSGFGEAFGPFLSATQAAMHSVAFRDNRKHYRRCPTCNPAGFPKGMRIDRSEYRRRRR